MKKFAFSSGLYCLMAGAALAGGAAPAAAQSGAEEIIVVGRYGKVPDSVQSLSQSVSYADLDLSTKAGKDILRQRLKLTARYLCDKLGESNTTTSAIPSCRDAAVNDAMDRLGTIEARFAPRGTSWVAGPAWQAPYPEAWVTTYP
jgi:UrcA family protein